MKNVSKYAKARWRDQKERLRGEVRDCDFCSTSVEAHNRCYAETAKTSGHRSQACLN